MEILSVPVIIVICYMIGEMYKVIVKSDGAKYKIIPIVVGVSGGLLGWICYYINPEIILNATDMFEAISIGIISGLASTGSDQVIRQILKKELKK